MSFVILESGEDMALTTRKNVIGGLGASVASFAMGAKAFALDASRDPAVLQKEIDEITPQMFRDFASDGNARGRKALLRFDAAFHKVFNEAATIKAEEAPAVWLVYNVGVVVKTGSMLFTIDLHHRLAPQIADRLDFALITHNHGDHYTKEFYDAMNRKLEKTVVNNFIDNYGAHRGSGPFGGGFTRGGKRFKFGDIEIITSSLDHNKYLVDYTMAFEVHIGNFTLYHTGDTSNIEKLNPLRRPDLWIVHPRCGLDVAQAVKKFQPRHTVIAHLNEMHHLKGKGRWTWDHGFNAMKKVKDLGFHATVPFWGDRIC